MPMVEITDSDLVKFHSMGQLFTGIPEQDEATVAALKELILNRNRWSWFRGVMFNTAKWLVVVGGGFTALKLGITDFVGMPK